MANKRRSLSDTPLPGEGSADRLPGAPGGGSGVCVDRAPEEGDETFDGGCMVIARLGWAESTWAGLLGQLGADEGQRLLGHIIM